MWESKYGTEPADLKLLAICIFQKLWVILLGAVAGGILFGGGYFVKHVVLAKEPEYQVNSMLYVDFVQGEGEAPKYYTFNTAGWSGFVKTDTILDKAMSYLEQPKVPITKEEMRNSVGASVDADYRVIDLNVTNADGDRALLIAHSVEKAFPDFAKEMKEIDQIRVMTSADSKKRILVDVYTGRRALGGAILTAVFLFCILLIYQALDDSIHVPITFLRRYHIPMQGVLEEESGLLQNSFIDNQNAIVTVRVGRSFPEKQVLDKIKDNTPVVLSIKAGAHNGKIIEQTLCDVKKAGGKVIYAILEDPDWKLIHLYYFNKKWKKNK